MNSRERIIKSLSHEEPDRVPLDLGSTTITGIHVDAWKNFLLKYKLKGSSEILYDITQQLVKIEDKYLDKFKIDTRGLFPEISSKELEIKRSSDYYELVDEYNMRWAMPINNGFYFDRIGTPLKNINTTKELNSVTWPDPKANFRFKKFYTKSKKIVDAQESICVLGRNIAGGIFSFAAGLFGYERFYTSFYANPSLACGLMDKLVETMLIFYEKAIKKTEGRIDIVHIADDLGTQKGLLISPKMYRKYVKPRHKYIVNQLKKKYNNIYFMLHSCGAIYNLIPDFIEAGFDILNPLQVSAKGMDTKKIKKQFGKDIVFWGGGVDTQYVLPQGTTTEVKDEVKKRIDDLAPGGGFVFAPVHNIQADVPPENILAMWEAWNEYKNY